MKGRKHGNRQADDSAGPGLELSVVVPCYNEARIIGKSFHLLKDACDKTGTDYEIIFGNDGSSDDTLGLIEALAEADPRVKVTSHYPNRGAGYTYREMYAAAGGKLIVQMDADMAMPPDVTLPSLLDALGRADMAVGSRYLGIRADYPLKRRVFSRGYALLTRLLFHLDVADTQTGFLGFHRRILDYIDLRSDGFELLVELIAQSHAAGFSIEEVGLPWYHDTSSGETDVWRESVKMLSGTVRLRWRLGRRRKTAVNTVPEGRFNPDAKR